MIQGLNGVTNIGPLTNTDRIQTVKQPDKSFSTILKDALNQVSKAELESDQKTELLAHGKIDNLHDVMIAAQKANITVETAVQVQQKVIDTYNEVMRMQV